MSRYTAALALEVLMVVVRSETEEMYGGSMSPTLSCVMVIGEVVKVSDVSVMEE